MAEARKGNRRGHGDDPAGTPELMLDAVLNSATDYAIFTMDSERRVTSWNIGAQNLLGWSADEIIGQSADRIFTPEDREQGAPEAEVRQALATGRAEDERWHLRKDGSRFWSNGLLMTLKGQEEGRGFLKILRDRTERKRLDELQDSQRLLLGELQHRVRNSLAVIRSVARRSAENCETVEEYAMHLDGRIGALSRAQAMLTREPRVSVDLEYLVAEELVGVAAREGAQFELSGPAVRLHGQAAVSVALAIHELATNAVKFGALGRPEGRLAVSWGAREQEGSDRLAIAWRETGVPLEGDAPRRRGFGTEVLERLLPYELKAETRMEFTPDGLVCTIDLPFSLHVGLAPGNIEGSGKSE